MKVLICTNHFYPETFKVNDIAWYLQGQGHEVTVLTAIPDYPKGHYYDGYGIFKKRVEVVNGVKVYRAYIFPRGNGSKWRLVLSYISYTFSSIFMALFLCLKHKFDAVFVHETSPIMIGIPGVIVKRIKKIPLYFWVLDLWPESLSAAGGIHNKYVLGFFCRMTKWIYRHSNKILISSNGFRTSILDKGNFDGKIEYFPNWGEDVFLNKPENDVLPELPEGFRIMFAGNMGEAQNLEKVLEVVRQLSTDEVKWIFIGDGRKRQWVEEYIHVHHLENRAFLLGNHPIEDMPKYFSQSDMMFLSLKNNDVFSLTVPAKLQAYMASSKPILAMIDGESAHVIEMAHAGYVTDSNNVEGMCDIIEKQVLPHRDCLKELGANGLKFYKENFHHDICMKNLTEKILKLDNVSHNKQ